MRFYITACCLIIGVMLVGCIRPPETKPQPPSPIASGEVIRAVLREEDVPANGMMTNDIEKAHIFTEGHVAVYGEGLVIIADQDGTKHAAAIYKFAELSFR